MKNIARKYLMSKLTLALIVLSGIVVFAAQNETVGRALNIIRPEIKIQISGTVARDNQTVSLDKVNAVKPGEVLDWKINSVNSGTGSAKNYRVVGQIPQGTTLVAESAKAQAEAKVTYSIDGGKTFSAQPMIDEKQADGSVKQVPAPVSMYTQLRFELANELPAQSEVNAAYSVKVK